MQKTDTVLERKEAISLSSSTKTSIVINMYRPSHCMYCSSITLFQWSSCRWRGWWLGWRSQVISTIRLRLKDLGRILLFCENIKQFWIIYKEIAAPNSSFPRVVPSFRDIFMCSQNTEAVFVRSKGTKPWLKQLWESRWRCAYVLCVCVYLYRST